MRGSTVLMSMMMAPGLALASTPSEPSTVASTSGDAGNIVTTMSLAWATPAAPLPRRAPSSSSTRIGSGLMSCTTSEKPLRCKFAAMGRPMRPSPMKPMVVMQSSILRDVMKPVMRVASSPREGEGQAP